MRAVQVFINAFLQPMRHVTVWCVLCLLLAAGSARAAVGDVFTVDGITYKTLTDSTVQVGNDTNRAVNDQITTVTVPVTVSYGGTNYTLTRIGDRAFYGCSGLTSVTLPASLTNIGDEAFYHCFKVTNFSVPSENPAFCAVDGVLFSKDMARLVAYPEARPGIFYTVPDGVTSIGNGAFSNCKSLSVVTLPASLTSIGDHAFAYCFAFTSVTFPTALTSIGDEAFVCCDKLTGFIVPSENQVFCVEDGVLFTKDKTCLVAYPNGRPDPFYTVPDEVTSVGNFAFSGCSKLKGFTVSSENPALCVEDGVLFNKSKTILMAYPSGKGDSYTVPAGVTGIGNSAFARGWRLTSVTLPESLSSIGDYAFYECDRLDNITYLGTREPSMGNDAFSGGSHEDRVLHIPNAKDGFDKSKWGASTVVYGHSKHSILYYLCSLFIVVGSCAYGIRKWRASVVGWADGK